MFTDKTIALSHNNINSNVEKMETQRKNPFFQNLHEFDIFGE